MVDGEIKCRENNTKQKAGPDPQKHGIAEGESMAEGIDCG